MNIKYSDMLFFTTFKLFLLRKSGEIVTLLLSVLRVESDLIFILSAQMPKHREVEMEDTGVICNARGFLLPPSQENVTRSIY